MCPANERKLCRTDSASLACRLPESSGAIKGFCLFRKEPSCANLQTKVQAEASRELQLVLDEFLLHRPGVVIGQSR